VDSQQLPSELDALETQLLRLRNAVRAPSLRGRVLFTVAQELRRERQRGWRLYATAVASLVVLWANLSWMASRDTTSLWFARSDMTVSAEQIEALVPGLSRREAARQALLLDSGRSLSAAVLAPISTPVCSNQ
jgi:hypothetical protein